MVTIVTVANIAECKNQKLNQKGGPSRFLPVRTPELGAPNVGLISPEKPGKGPIRSRESAAHENFPLFSLACGSDRSCLITSHGASRGWARYGRTQYGRTQYGRAQYGRAQRHGTSYF
jgi:hypothetical protein